MNVTAEAQAAILVAVPHPLPTVKEFSVQRAFQVLRQRKKLSKRERILGEGVKARIQVLFLPLLQSF